jgi:hypothetical protein
MIKHDQLIQNRYRVIRLLGSGGFGSVYMAEDTRLHRVVALKEMDAARLGPDERAIAEPLFEREARTLASLDHPGLTRIWDYFEDDRRAYLVMEYVPGQTLRDLLHRSGPLDEGFVLECALQLSAVLAYLHSRRPPVIFRDLKPANVMVVAEADEGVSGAAARSLAHFVLIDFGIARFFKPDQVGDTLIIGTPGYAPPEQYGQGQTDQRSDIYSLGATMFHLLGGQTPAAVPPPPLASVNPRVSSAMAQVVARATKVDPAERYQSIEELRRDLLTIARERAHGGEASVRVTTSPGAAPVSRPTTTLPQAPAFGPRPRQSSPVMLLVVVLAIVGLVTLGGVVLGGLRRLGGGSQAGGPTPLPRPTAAPPAREWLLPNVPGALAFGQRGPQGEFDVWVATLDGSAPRQLTSDGQSYAPARSPDGTRLALTHGRDGQRAVYVGDETNPLAARVGPVDMEARYPAWSPDGSRLAMAVGEGRSWRLAIADLQTGEITFPNAPAGIGGLAWGPGRLLAFAVAPAPGQPQDIYVLDANGAARNLTDTPEVEEDLPAWSPDGRQLAFVASPAGGENLSQRQIFVMSADGSGRTQLTSGPGPHANPTWSPDGAWIAYVAQENSADWQVWAMRADGSAPRQLTVGPERKFYLSWGK